METIFLNFVNDSGSNIVTRSGLRKWFFPLPEDIFAPVFSIIHFQHYMSQTLQNKFFSREETKWNEETKWILETMFIQCKYKQFNLIETRENTLQKPHVSF